MSGVQISLPRPIRQIATGFLFWPVLADLLFEGTTFLRLALQSLAFPSDVECSLADLSGARPRTVVTVAQLVEPWTVTPVVAGSNPVSHHIFLRVDITFIPFLPSLRPSLALYICCQSWPPILTLSPCPRCRYIYSSLDINLFRKVVV